MLFDRTVDGTDYDEEVDQVILDGVIDDDDNLELS